MWILAGSEGMFCSHDGHMEISPSESWGSAAMVLRASPMLWPSMLVAKSAVVNAGSS